MRVFFRTGYDKITLIAKQKYEKEATGISSGYCSISNRFIQSSVPGI